MDSRALSVPVTFILLAASILGPLATYGMLAGDLADMRIRISELERSDLEPEVRLVATNTDFVKTTEYAMPSVVRIQAGSSDGSGVIYDARGYILTNKHVVEDAERVRVTLSDGSSLRGTVLGVSKDHDLAVVRVRRDLPLPALPFASSSDLKVGLPVLAMGNPEGMEFSVSQGIISAEERTIQGATYLQADVSINPGNSGGPLVLENGSVIGINTLKLRDSEGLSFAIPADLAAEFATSFLP